MQSLWHKLVKIFCICACPVGNFPHKPTQTETLLEHQQHQTYYRGRQQFEGASNYSANSFFKSILNKTKL